MTTAALIIVGALALTVGAVALGWVRSVRRDRRRARYLATLKARYEPPRRTQPAGEPVTVQQLVARVQREGLPVRPNWAHEGDDLPTVLLPRVEP
jgi:type II secretory pathway pseudopilin PulG